MSIDNKKGSLKQTSTKSQQLFSPGWESDAKTLRSRSPSATACLTSSSRTTPIRRTAPALRSSRRRQLRRLRRRRRPRWRRPTFRWRRSFRSCDASVSRRCFEPERRRPDQAKRNRFKGLVQWLFVECYDQAKLVADKFF